ncbi:DUF3275 family protein [Vibrio sp. 10N.261.46.E12]|uniref:DUF3275 domain-containing protein n=1 Tax=Vibrio splendidus TaxID=29497 RepID=A0A2N7CET4_VIBSP|nr:MULTISPECIES: DUF3275 family protein [Vibrio]PMF21620.1 hypothetical protein BCV19_08235 [Vibrio splendidus]PML97078.1 hypothetical protein BCT66_01885 [Vibrio sp. 10N.261.49.E11]PMN81793.1 hypothetical protein BCT25_14320 [Vibrio sp. 10N.261.45.A6]PMN85800.1 hypothetical protein BCT22_09100 [Vibrio sp. 10N.261.45.A1]
MVQVPGTLTIKTVSGRYGDFNVAMLDTDIGQFSVRDAVLDEYSEGTYQGTFGLQRIYPGSYQTSNRFVIETRAELNGIWLSDYKEEALPRDEPMEEDPLAKERKAQQQLTEQRDVASQALASSQESQEDLVSLFGALWPLPSHIGDIVKLTPEVGREVMGKQLAYLKRRINDERVWKFEPKAQHWMRQRHDEEAS